MRRGVELKAGFEVVNDGSISMSKIDASPDKAAVLTTKYKMEQKPTPVNFKFRPRLDRLKPVGASLPHSLAYDPVYILVLLLTFFKQYITSRKSINNARLTSSGIRSNLLF